MEKKKSKKGPRNSLESKQLHFFLLTLRLDLLERKEFPLDHDKILGLDICMQVIKKRNFQYNYGMFCCTCLGEQRKNESVKTGCLRLIFNSLQ